MLIKKKIEEKIKMFNLNEALESHNNHCTLFAVNLLSVAIGWDAEIDLNSALLALVCSKKKLPMKDLLDATGLSKRDYLTIFDVEDDRRWLKMDTVSLARMSFHLERPDLLPRQRELSKLLFKLIGGKVMEEIKYQYNLLTGGYLEDDYCFDDTFQFETYNISLDELNDAMRLFFIHYYDLQPKEVETR